MNSSFYRLTALALCCASPALGQWSDDLDTYALPSPLEGQGGWESWAGPGMPSGTTVVEFPAGSGNGAIALESDNDSVHGMNGPYTSGEWLLCMRQFIPSGSTGSTYLIVLSEFAHGGFPVNWAMQNQFDADTGLVVADSTGVSAPLIYDEWVDLVAVVDLDNDVAETFYGGTSLGQWTWTAGVFSPGPLKLHTVDLFAVTGASPVYFDNLVLLPSSSIGTSYCGPGIQTPNSTGSIGSMQVMGSTVAADGQLALMATDLPPNQTGYFVWSTSPAQIPLPGVSNGVICLGSGKGRFNGVGPNQGAVLDSGADGTFLLCPVDTTVMPQSSQPPIPIAAGMTGHFQAWHRDPAAGGAANNFTDAVMVTWN